MRSPFLKNGVEIVCPHGFDLVKRCVYKMSFDSGGFYIGSTTDLRKRVMVYRCNMNQRKFATKNLTAASTSATQLIFTIIEKVGNDADLFKQETFWINELKSEYMLNRSMNASSTLGVRWTDEEKSKISKGLTGVKKSEETKIRMRQSVRSPYPRKPPKPINNFLFKYICQCTCTGRVIRYIDAANELGLTQKQFQYHMSCPNTNWTNFIPVGKNKKPAGN